MGLATRQLCSAVVRNGREMVGLMLRSKLELKVEIGKIGIDKYVLPVF